MGEERQREIVTTTTAPTTTAAPGDDMDRLLHERLAAVREAQSRRGRLHLKKETSGLAPGSVN